ncbi:hypothetical protein BaRGS_00009158 [Batillaria attramentaria]|uniref:Ankyrin repeat, SAM and basic leucine zipper domain-containing protein 1 n=1 Tax=Batillaria attramentaria TaxID=370345 RepID=A0ABD0LJP1_9CAEN
MAASFKPAGAESDSDDDFMFGDDDLSAVNSETVSGSQGPGPVQNGKSSRVTFGLPSSSRSKPSSALAEDFRMGIIQGNIQAVRKALDQGLDVNTVLTSSWSGLMYAGSFAKGDIFKLLLERGANPNYHKDLFTVLMAVCSSNCSKPDVLLECAKLLIDKGVDVNARDRYHVTALTYAAREGRVELVKLLLDNGAEIDRQDSRGWTAVSWATQREQLGVIKELLDRGADRNKKHTDGLTAIDLARGKDEIVWLFEGKPVPEVGAGDAASGTGAVNLTSPKQGVNGTVDLRYGDLEVFLYGLDLGQFLEVFRAHHVDFALLLTFIEEDLVNMGITQVGVRKKIMEGVAAVHKRNWESSSLVPIRVKSEVRCADAVAIVANLSKHLRYISSSVTYIKDHLQRNADFLATTQDGSGPKQLLLHTGDGIKNISTVQQEMQTLYTILSKELANKDFSPPDLITPTMSSRWKVRGWRLAFAFVSISSVALLVWKRDSVTETLTSLVDRIRLKFS